MARNKKMQENTSIDCSLNQDTLDFLKLSKQPFGQEILSSNTYFNSPELEKISETLKYQAQFSDLLLIVEGVYGSGKTSLYRQLIQTDIPNIKLLPVQAEATDTLTQIQQKISIHLEDLGDANHLDSNLKSLQSFDQTPLLILDDAHVLSDTTLQELFRYQQQLLAEQDVNLKFAFFSSPGLGQTLENITDIQAAKIYTQSMPVYTEKQAQLFIQFKLNAAGYNGEPFPDEKSLQLIIKKSDGTALNTLHFAATLIEKQVEKITSPSLPAWVKWLVISLILITLLAGLLIYLGIFQSVIPDKQASTEQSPQTSNAIEFKAENTTPENTDSVVTTEDKDSSVETFSLNKDAPDNLPDTESLPEQMPREASPAKTVLAEKSDVVNEAQEAASLTSHLASEAPAEKASAETTLTDKPEVVVANAPPLVPVTKTKSTAQTKQAAQASAENPAKRSPDLPSPAKVAAPVKNAKPALIPALQQLNKMGLHDADWLMQQNSSAWTIQLLGAREPETLLQFSRTHQLKQNAAWYKTWLKGQAYYVLTYSIYDSRDQARSAIEQLPGPLRKTKPWVKSIKAVQQAIK